MTVTEKAMATHSSTLAWKIPWMEEPGGLQSMWSLRVGHDWATSLSLFTFHALEKEMATHSSVLTLRIPGMGEPGGLPSMGSHRVGHDWSDLAAAAAYDHFWCDRSQGLTTNNQILSCTLLCQEVLFQLFITYSNSSSITDYRHSWKKWFCSEFYLFRDLGEY